MTNEELLKAISSMLKNNEEYLNDNPEVFFDIQDRLLTAIGHRDVLKKADEEDEDKKKDKKVSRSGYGDWQPKDEKDYTPEQLKAIQEHMDEGFSHREAERFANAHNAPKDFQSALNSRVNPSREYSDKFHDIMRDVALDHKKRAADVEGKNADPGVNPQKYAAYQAKEAHNKAYGDYDKDYQSFLTDLDEKDLHPNDYDQAVSDWQENWHKDNPEAKEGMIDSAEGGKAFDDAKQARQDKVKEGQRALMAGGLGGSEESSTGEFSEDAGGDVDDKSLQTAAQMIGGQKGEGGYEAGVVKDPNAIFREQNPEFVNDMKRKLADKLGQNPEAKERHDAMPPRERTPQAPAKVMRGADIPQHIRDKYETPGKKKPEGGE